MATTRRDKMCDDEYRIVDEFQTVSAEAIGIGVGQNQDGEWNALINVDFQGVRLLAPISREQVDEFCNKLREAVDRAEEMNGGRPKNDSDPTKALEELLKALIEAKRKQE